MYYNCDYAMMMSSIRMSVVGGVVTLISDVESQRCGLGHEVKVRLVHNLYQISVNVSVVEYNVPPTKVVPGREDKHQGAMAPMIQNHAAIQQQRVLSPSARMRGEG